MNLRSVWIGIIVFIIILLICNYTPVKWILDFGKEYHYSTLHGEATAWEMPSKGHSFENVLEGFEQYKQLNSHTTDTILYRNFRRNPLHIWKWHEYLFHPRYKLPYLNPDRKMAISTVDKDT
jgi:hypothetical protein